MERYFEKRMFTLFLVTKIWSNLSNGSIIVSGSRNMFAQYNVADNVN